MKIPKKKIGGVQVGGWGGGGSGLRGGGGVQGGCEWRSEAFVKIQEKKNWGGVGVGVGVGGRFRGGGSGWGVRLDGNGEVKLV